MTLDQIRELMASAEQAYEEYKKVVVFSQDDEECLDSDD